MRWLSRSGKIFTGARGGSSDPECDAIHSVAFTDVRELGTDFFPKDVKCTFTNEKDVGNEKSTVLCSIPEVTERDPLTRAIQPDSEDGIEYRATWDATRVAVDKTLHCVWTGWMIDVHVLGIKRGKWPGNVP